jgi:L-ascorbate metabolism protein UlaG (beta-lactamase superfamily)
MRMRPTLLPVIMLACSGATAQSKVTIHPIHHGTLALEWNQLTIYVDPADGGARFKDLPAPDLILITDIHGDHMDPVTLAAIDRSKAKIIAPPAVMEGLPAEMKSIGKELRNGVTMEIKEIGIEAVPMYNLPESPDAFHTKGRGNGYVLTLGDDRIYISGDTEDIPEMRALRDIDIAFVCMNLPYTMTVDQAADGVLAFKPKVVYPYHYRGTEGLSDVARFKELVTQGDPKIEVRQEDWYKN